jgi:FkbM family methyltransferase
MVIQGRGNKQGLAMKLVEGWQVPDIDECCINALLVELPDLNVSYTHMNQFRTVIQAGGNIGVYPATMAGQFERVITVEPDLTNYQALLLNVAGHDNIEHHWAAFGDKIGTASVDHPYPENIGAHQLKAGNDVRVLTIDSLCVDNCDFIQLDIEGYEHLALLGAERTIKKTYPVITLELKGLGSRYGYTDEDTIGLLQGWGYEIVGRVNRDVIFARY